MRVFSLYRSVVSRESVALQAPTHPGLKEEEIVLQKAGVNIGKFLSLAIQLGLLVLVIRRFQIENYAFFKLSLLTFFGFMIHYFLPFRYRLPFFLTLSLAGIGIVLGFLSGVWLVGIGLVLIATCHLPISFAGRVVVLLLVGACLAALRTEWIQAPWSRAIWPILGSMFMFRLIVYLRDLRHDKAPISVTSTLSYFFLLPNVCFPLFPVIDYKTLRRSYYQAQVDPHWTYQRGVQWILRGIIHLLLYRFVYYYLTIAPSQVTDLGDLMRYLLSNFLLYLRVSGQFHLIVGMIHLFGFNLPETHYFYYLASSFNDFWRRINIYWKDFMMKLFYYPCFFKLRTWGTTAALVLSTLVVFIMTWLLHSYQWFWLRGSFPVLWQDGLFWGLLALLVVANSLYESRHGRERTLGRHLWTVRSTAGLALRTVGTFTLICILWSLWTSDSLSTWAALWLAAAQPGSGTAMLWSILFLVALGLGSIVVHRLRPNRDDTVIGTSGLGQRSPIFYRTAAVTGTLITLVFLTGQRAVYTSLGPTVAEVIPSLREARLNRDDAALLEKGYYEDLVRVDRFNSELWLLYTGKPPDWVPFHRTEGWRPTNDFLIGELAPSIEILRRGYILRTNRWGMRDKDYERKRPPFVYRIALLGSSHTAGQGVANDETFEALLEERLNRENDGGSYAGYEILNFAVGGYSPLQQVMVVEKALSFEPNALFYVAHTNDPLRATWHLDGRIRHGSDIPYDDLKKMAAKAGVTSETPAIVSFWRLSRINPEIVSWAYHQIVEACRAHGVQPVWILLARPEEWVQENATVKLIQLAEEAGFIVLNLIDVFKDQDVKSLILAEWDNHSNAKGHQLIADRLYGALKEKAQVLALDPPRRTGGGPP